MNLRRNQPYLRTLAAWAVLALLLAYFLAIHPRGASVAVITAWSNQSVALALLAVGQTIVVLSKGIDLSIGPIMALTNCVASHLVNGSPIEVAVGMAAVIAVGALCGLVNGLLVVVVRMQAIVATLATGAVFSGLALIVRPIPGGDIAEGVSDFFTGDIAGLIPVALIVMLFVALSWSVIRRTILGRTIIAVGSAGPAAYASGLPATRARIAAFVMAGIFAAFSGLFVSFQTLSGDPTIGLSYTLNSIAAVVIGGTALTGGIGTVVGSIAGAMILRTIGNLLFFNDIEPLAQPLFEGLVLLIAVSFGATRMFKMKSRLEAFR